MNYWYVTSWMNLNNNSNMLTTCYVWMNIKILEKAKLYQQKADQWLPGDGVVECKDWKGVEGNFVGLWKYSKIWIWWWLHNLNLLNKTQKTGEFYGMWIVSHKQFCKRNTHTHTLLGKELTETIYSWNKNENVNN